MIARTRGRQAGTSLLEVLCAISLFALVAAAVSSLSGTSFRNTVENRHATAAALLAQQDLERMRALEYVDITAASSSQYMGGQSFTVARVVQTDVPAAGMKTITVTVTWIAPTGSKSYAAQTIYTDITG